MPQINFAKLKTLCSLASSGLRFFCTLQLEKFAVSRNGRLQAGICHAEGIILGELPLRKLGSYSLGIYSDFRSFLDTSLDKGLVFIS